MKVISILCCLFNIQGRETYLCDLVKQKLNIGLYSDIYRPISWEITKIYILISVLMTLISFKAAVVKILKNFGIHFLRNLAVDVDEIQCASTTWWICWSLY